jgi:hypothetical protein
MKILCIRQCSASTTCPLVSDSCRRYEFGVMTRCFGNWVSVFDVMLAERWDADNQTLVWFFVIPSVYSKLPAQQCSVTSEQCVPSVKWEREKEEGFRLRGKRTDGNPLVYPVYSVYSVFSVRDSEKAGDKCPGIRVIIFPRHILRCDDYCLEFMGNMKLRRFY